MNRVFITILFIVIYCFFVSDLMARKIVFVYDDSKSMWWKAGENEQQRKWMFANYAAQTMAALLRDDDRFIAIKMSNQEVIDLQACNQKSIELIKNSWKPKKSKTPYEAVEKAMSEILKSDTLSDNKMDEQKQDWLLIMTDGKFALHGRTDLIDEDYNYIKESARKFLDNTKGKVRIAFFLIGKDADENIPQIWSELSTGQVKKFNVKADDIIEKVRDTALLAIGCDSQQVNFTQNGRMLEVTSFFPVRRITVFEQKSTGQLAKVTRVISPDQKSVRITDYQINNHPESTVILSAKVTHCMFDNKKVMPEGVYQIYFKQNIEPHDIQVLIESAVDFQVVIERNDTGPCLGDAFVVSVNFTKAGTREPLKLDHKNTQQMVVKALLGDIENEIEKPFEFNPTQNNFDPIICAINQYTQTLSVAAQHKGYFNLKSNIFKINSGKECEYSIQLEKNEMHVTYSFTDDKFAGHNSLTIKKLYFDSFDIDVTGIPAGITFQIAGQQLSSEKTHLELNKSVLDENNVLPFIVLNNRDYKEHIPSYVYITFRIPDEEDAISKKTLMLKPTCRKIKLLPDSIIKPIHIGELGDKEPFKISLTGDDTIISEKELSHWKITAKTQNNQRLRLAPVSIINAQIFIKPLPWYEYECSKCFSSSGQQQMHLYLESPFPKENQEKLFTFVISSHNFIVTCFKVCMLPILFMIFGIFLFFYYVKWQQKAKFIKGAAITMTKFDDENEKRPNTIFLQPKGFSRWFPFFSEKITIGNYVFEATNTVYLKVKPIINHKSGKIFIGGIENNSLSANLGPGTILEDRFSSGSVHKYSYKTY